MPTNPNQSVVTPKASAPTSPAAPVSNAPILGPAPVTAPPIVRVPQTLAMTHTPPVNPSASVAAAASAIARQAATEEKKDDTPTANVQSPSTIATGKATSWAALAGKGAAKPTPAAATNTASARPATVTLNLPRYLKTDFERIQQRMEDLKKPLVENNHQCWRTYLGVKAQGPRYNTLTAEHAVVSVDEWRKFVELRDALDHQYTDQPIYSTHVVDVPQAVLSNLDATVLASLHQSSKTTLYYYVGAVEYRQSKYGTWIFHITSHICRTHLLANLQGVNGTTGCVLHVVWTAGKLD